MRGQMQSAQESLRDGAGNFRSVKSKAIHGDARKKHGSIKDESIDLARVVPSGDPSDDSVPDLDEWRRAAVG